VRPATTRARITRGCLAALSLALPLFFGSAAAEPFFLPVSAQGRWTAADKQLHFAGSLAISASLRTVGRTDGESFGGAVGIGVLKELYDATLKPRRNRRGASWKDLAADILGAAAGIAIAGALDR
jgi:uncharacterized protein YfiM (DUF2279 family)